LAELSFRPILFSGSDSVTSPADDSAFGLGGSVGESVSLLGVALDGPSLGGLLRGVALAELSVEVEEESGFLPGLVGVSGGFAVLPAAGDGAILFEVLAVSGVDGVDDLAVGDDRLGVGGNE
jgi:hypothetical protein